MVSTVIRPNGLTLMGLNALRPGSIVGGGDAWADEDDLTFSTTYTSARSGVVSIDSAVGQLVPFPGTRLFSVTVTLRYSASVTGAAPSNLAYYVGLSGQPPPSDPNFPDVNLGAFLTPNDPTITEQTAEADFTPLGDDLMAYYHQLLSGGVVLISPNFTGAYPGFDTDQSMQIFRVEMTVVTDDPHPIYADPAHTRIYPRDTTTRNYPPPRTGRVFGGHR